ncbi:MAG: Threonylcarbamoyladenosine tRNA methylthiotransferase MtaB [Candidatus Omnitrophica bacterium ADurb.Bin205]|nr:MAG: Threonylcarbamoyladenosine tRNA methylthiotransferase MtaB [Candidatus Omnitrophica bacterium ADurb.Bin205]
MKIKFYTLGCKVNQYDTQSIRERFLRHGFKEAKSNHKAGTYLINTCSVTSSADRKSREIIRRCIRENPHARIIVTGCLVKKDAPMVAQIKGVSLIVSKDFFCEGISNFSGHTRVFLKIQDGCNNFCSYCKVPLVRGRSRSRPLDEILREAKFLAGKGFKEFVLTGICLGAYGRDLKDKQDLVSLISALEAVRDIVRIRLSSIEAGDLSDKLINKIAKSKKVCPHLHIPIQSGDDQILKAMNRRYTSSKYLSLIKRIKTLIPKAAITTDVLVGFPGESEENFQNTVNLIRKICPLKVHIFPYSPRKGTKAADLRLSLSPKVMAARIGALKSIEIECAMKYKRQFLNKNLEVLIEGRNKKDPVYWEGYSRNYIEFLVKSGNNLKNQLIFCRPSRMAEGRLISSYYNF